MRPVLIVSFRGYTNSIFGYTLGTHYIANVVILVQFCGILGVIF